MFKKKKKRARSGSGTFNFINSIYKVFIIFISDELGEVSCSGRGDWRRRGAPGVLALYGDEGGMGKKQKKKEGGGSLSVLLVFVSAFSAVI